MKKVVIIGGGFGGVYAAKYLSKYPKDFEVTLISDNNYFLFTPLLHEVATGGLSEKSVAEPIREIFRKTKVRFIKERVLEVRKDKKIVKTETGEISYDELIISTGSESRPPEGAFSLKTLNDARVLRRRIIDEVEKDYGKEITFVVVGAGPTGIEVACELEEFLHDTLCDKYYPDMCHDHLRIVLIHSKDSILEQFHKKVRDFSMKILKKKRIEIILSDRMAEYKDGKVTTDNGKVIDTNVLIWTAGVKANNNLFDGEVDNYLKTKEGIYVVGDASGKGPMLAQKAVDEALYVTRSIRGEDDRPYVFQKKGMLLSLGNWMAAGEVGGFVIRGRFAWWVWRTIYLFKFNSNRKRLRIAFEWTVNLFFPRDITAID
ncbi:MAG: FAD-dependent oxidoreductase [Candidatus Pacebacteria bacterium]|nr:FAD-dependent oxidoreductase [Candidatus Paceibacterota bacterium]